MREPLALNGTDLVATKFCLSLEGTVQWLTDCVAASLLRLLRCTLCTRHLVSSSGVSDLTASDSKLRYSEACL